MSNLRHSTGWEVVIGRSTNWGSVQTRESIPTISCSTNTETTDELILTRVVGVFTVVDNVNGGLTTRTTNGTCVVFNVRTTDFNNTITKDVPVKSQGGECTSTGIVIVSVVVRQNLNVVGCSSLLQVDRQGSTSQVDTVATSYASCLVSTSVSSCWRAFLIVVKLEIVEPENVPRWVVFSAIPVRVIRWSALPSTSSCAVSSCWRAVLMLVKLEIVEPLKVPE